jgi:hypothetical protein
MSGALSLQLSGAGADAERLAALTGYLRAEPLQLDVEDVTALQVGEAPPGAQVPGCPDVRRGDCWRAADRSWAIGRGSAVEERGAWLCYSC